VNPFDALGLPARPDLTDEQVRAAWRTIAAATHPDRPGGGDVARYTEATAAYAVLRTPWGRSEALADLTAAADDTSPLPAVEVGEADTPSASAGGGPAASAAAGPSASAGGGPSASAAGGPAASAAGGPAASAAGGPSASAAGGPSASAGGGRAAGPADLVAAVARLPARIRHGRPLRLVIRALAAAALSLAVLALIPGQPAAPALVTGLITWFLLTGRSDLAPPR
jgi:hypothetical protein